MIRPLVAAVAVVLLAGCAKRPDAITPMSMPANAYSGLSCAQLASEHQKSSAALTTVSQAQNNAATGDAVGVFLIGVPMSSTFGGDQEGKVAQHKGEIVAIEAMQKNKGC
ncbi:hypothetical protein [Mesorhizobium marinum]|uniref:Lipoprotein n=1 Tax=Mesorhizobium marinum TaxID=3228790 RepID=A0ABV3R5W5_9HYPH